MIPLFWPSTYPDEWTDGLKEIFETRWIGQGPKVNEFEQEFGKKFGFNYCLAVNSGSAALELTYHLLDLQEGDEVLVPVFTCTATNIPLKRRKAKLVFVDINQDTLTMDYEDFANKITTKTKAIVTVTLGGMPVDERIYKLAKEKKIPVVVDAAQSVGIPEPHGDYVCYSFQAIKHFTTGDGGMLVLRNKDEYKRAKKLRWFGIDREAKIQADWKWQVNHQMAMDIEEPGFKYHMNDISATLGLVGLKHSDEIMDYRRRLCWMYEKGLPEHKLVCGGAYWLIALLTDKRDELMDYLKLHGVESDMIQIRNDVFTVFGGKRLDLPNMNEIESQYLYLPLNPMVTFDNVDYITKLINDFTRKN